MQRMWLVLALMLLPLAALAQEDTAPAAGQQAVDEAVAAQPPADGATDAQPVEGAAVEVPEVDFEMVPYHSIEFNFGIALPAGGKVYDPDSDEWLESRLLFKGKPVVTDDEDTFIWIREGVAPVALIKGRIGDSDLTQAEFFTPHYEKTVAALKAAYLEGDNADRFKLAENGTMLMINGHPFAMFEIEQLEAGENEDEQLAAYYSIYLTYNGPYIHSFFFGYPSPANEITRDACIAILATFSPMKYAAPAAEETETAAPDAEPAPQDAGDGEQAAPAPA